MAALNILWDTSNLKFRPSPFGYKDPPEFLMSNQIARSTAQSDD
jgi:hypothetical protein